MKEFHQSLQKAAFEKGIPVYGGFELTTRCNLSCRMCYVKGAGAGKSNHELTANQWVELGRAARDGGALAVFLTGGEPLIRDDFKEIYEAFCRLGLRLTLFTNGTLINEELAKWLSQIPPAAVDITLYGASETTYRNLCGSGEAFHKAMGGLELLLKNNITTRIKTTVVRSNVHDYQAVQTIALSYGLEFLPSNLIHGNRITGIKNINDERLSPGEIYSFDLANLEQGVCSPIDLENIKGQYKDSPAMFCLAGKCSFFINWLGRLVPCNLFEKPYTVPLDVGFKQAWDLLRHQVTQIPGLENCKGCELRAFCPVCPGRLYLETGKFDGHSEYVCLLAKEKERMMRNINL
ncbi:MAG: hypothetical protein VR67_18905 [Peptococcaceae bacterium BRH_c8a]|nr:MAG: hypothetical protein VR67_18905 [Peptococcaceae bacterium BRH_c8a]